MGTRRQFLQSLSAASALLALTGRPARADVAPTSRQQQQAMTPEQALAQLRDGNERFASGKTLPRNLMAQVRASAAGQYPFAAVLGCIDSRVPPELVFDQGIGDIFSPRIAGNFADTDLIGSLEFATRLAGAKLIVVLGHTECGAIKGACDNAQLGSLTQTLSNLAPAVYAATGVPGERSSRNLAFVREVTAQNVRLTVEALTERSGVLRDLVGEQRLQVVGAIYEVATGRVAFSDGTK
jgi:carbonic anhydrase